MKIFKQMKWFLLLLILLALTHSCSEDEQLELNNKISQISDNENFIDIETATNIATEIEHFILDDNQVLAHSKTTSKKSKKINSVEEVKGNNEETLFYSINYDGGSIPLNKSNTTIKEKGGFLLLSADKRIAPVLAYSENGTWDSDYSKMSPGLIEWLIKTKEYIQYIRNENEPIRDEILPLWETSSIENFINSSEQSNTQKTSNRTAGDCEAEYLTKGPILETNWGQWSGYNNFAPNLGCSNSSNGRAPTGCVATAMAQIMNYHEYPSNYNWSIMPNNTGSNETSRLMRDAADAVNMDWGCNGSSASTGDAASALVNTFGYSSANYGNYSWASVKEQIRRNRPVILRGADCRTVWIFFEDCETGHAWVCDGYRSLRFSPHCFWLNDLYAYYSLHMNWGWNSQHNGWYSWAFWTPGNHDYSDNKKMIYNIQP